MRRHPTFRPAITVALALVIAVGSGLPGLGGAHAQTDGNNVVDPPSRVGRASRLLGTVSFHAAEDTGWRRASMNYPVTSGDAFWTEPSSAAEIDMGQAHLALDQSTELDVNVLDGRSLQVTQPQGAIFLRVRAMAVDDVYRIATPRGAVAIIAPGAYEIVAGDADHATTVTVVDGAARIDSTNASLTLTARQTGRVDGASNFAVSVVPAVTGPFLAARLADERRLARPAQTMRAAAPAVVAAMTGGDELLAVGDWADSPRFGAIWYPPVAKAWVPYRDGHWGYVAPWGWTWIDDAPWGFTPSHYGRWVRDGQRWGWVPVEREVRGQVHETPVYAPALVSFISIGAGVSVGAGIAQAPGSARGSVGWVPLGPRETYVPPYKTSDRYVKAVNVANVTNVTSISNVTNVTTVNNLVNREAATVVPMAAMTGSQPVAARAESVTPRALAGARSERASMVQPTMATSGVTPIVAKTLQLATPATPIPMRPAAPGPAAVPLAAMPLASVPVVTVQSPVVKRVDPAPGAAVVPPAPVAAVPVAVALPMLRAPVPAAPAHPRAGGTAVGAAPAAVSSGTPVIKLQEPSKPVIPAQAPAAPPASASAPVLSNPPISPAPQATAPPPAAAVTPSPLARSAEPAKPAPPPASAPVTSNPPISPAPQATAPPPAAAVTPSTRVRSAEPAKPAPPPASALAPSNPPISPVPQATAPPPAAAVTPAPLVRSAEPAKPVPPPVPAPGNPPISPAPQATAPPPAAAVTPAPLVRSAEPAKAAPPPAKQPEPVQPEHAPGALPIAAPSAAKPEMPPAVKPAEPHPAPHAQAVAPPPAPAVGKPAVSVPGGGHAAEAPKPHGPDSMEAPAARP